MTRLLPNPEKVEHLDPRSMSELQVVMLALCLLQSDENPSPDPTTAFHASTRISFEDLASEAIGKEGHLLCFWLEAFQEDI